MGGGTVRPCNIIRPEKIPVVPVSYRLYFTNLPLFYVGKTSDRNFNGTTGPGVPLCEMFASHTGNGEFPPLGKTFVLLYIE